MTARTAAVLVAGLLVSAAIALPSRVAADGGVGWPDASGDSGDAPDITSLSVSVEADELILIVDFADAPPLASAPDGSSTDVLVLFVGEAGGEPAGAARTGFTLGLSAKDGPERTRFYEIRSGHVGAEELGVASARYDAGSVIFRLPASRLPESSSVIIRLVAATDSETSAMDFLPDGGGWATFAPSDLGGGGPALTSSLLLIIGSLLVGAGPLIWVQLRARRMRLRLERAALP